MDKQITVCSNIIIVRQNVIYSYTVEDKIKFTFRPVKRSSKKPITSITARAQKLQQNDPVRRTKKRTIIINTTILRARQQCKLLFNKFNEVQRIVTF